MDDKWERLGAELERARGDMKAASVARAIGISGKQLRNYERGIGTSGRPGVERLLALAAYYGQDPVPWLNIAGYQLPTKTIRLGAAVEVTGALTPEAESVLRDLGERFQRDREAAAELEAFSDDALLAEVRRRMAARNEVPVGPDLYDLAAHTDGPGYVRDYEQDVAPDEGA